MMKLNYLAIYMLFVISMGCGTSKNTNAAKSDDTKEVSLADSHEKKNRMTISLLDQIRRLPGVTLRNGVPVFTKNSNTVSPNSTGEPLYILNDYIVGSSFRNVNQLVQNVNVDKIEAITGPDATIYGTRGANGVIKITTIE